MKASHWMSAVSLAIVLGMVSVVRAQDSFNSQVSPTSFNLANAPTPAEPAAGAGSATAAKPNAPAPDASGAAWADGDTWRPAPWTISADGLIMHRSSPSPMALLRTGTLQTGSVAYDASQLDVGYTGGWNINAVRHGEKADLELNFFALDGAEETTSIPGSLYAVTDMDGAHLNMTAPWLEYSSRLYSGEINVRAQRNEWLTLLAGFRFVELDEKYKAAGWNDVNAASLGFADYTANHLWGYQIGADGLLFSQGRLSIQGLVKAGIYWNHSDLTARQFDNAATGHTYNVRGDEDNAAFVGEVGLLGKYRFSEHAALHAGYQLMWLDGVATATDQLSTIRFGNGTNSLAGIEDGNTVFYHGFVVGSEFRW